MLENLVNHYTDGNKAQFAKIVGVSPQTLSKWIGRKTFNAELIYEKCEKVSAEWLLSGEGSMIKDKDCYASDSPSSSSPVANNDIAPVSDNDMVCHAMTHESLAKAEVMKERIKSLEALLQEKERLIKVLMEERK